MKTTSGICYFVNSGLGTGVVFLVDFVFELIVDNQKSEIRKIIASVTACWDDLRLGAQKTLSDWKLFGFYIAKLFDWAILGLKNNNLLEATNNEVT